MSNIFKDQELIDALDDVYRSVNSVRISSITHDPATFVRLVERMGKLSTLLVQKLAKDYNEIGLHKRHPPKAQEPGTPTR